MPTSSIVQSGFYSRNDIVKHTALSTGKSLLIDALRELFRNDSMFPYRDDAFGFPIVPDFTDLPNEEGGLQLDENEQLIDSSQLATKILITSTYRQDVKFYPVITVKQTSSKNHPISFNQNAIQIHYRKEFIRDGYGNQIEIRTPTHYVFSDAIDQTFEIKIVTEDIADRDEIADIVDVGLWHIKRDELHKAGLFIKEISGGGEIEEESVKSTSKWLYTYTFTLACFSEWERAVPIRSVVERINLYFDIQRTGILPSSINNVLTNEIPDSAALIAVIE